MVDEEHQRLMKVYGTGKNYSIRAYGGYESIKGDKPELFSCGTSAFFERSARLLRECPKVYLAFQQESQNQSTTSRRQWTVESIPASLLRARHPAPCVISKSPRGHLYSGER